MSFVHDPARRHGRCFGITRLQVHRFPSGTTALLHRISACVGCFRCAVFVLAVVPSVHGLPAQFYFDAPYLSADTSYRPNGIAIGDFNRDEVADLAIANSAWGVSVLIGKGKGMFHPHVEYNVISHGSAATTGVVTADFDADERLDLAVTVTTGEHDMLALLFGNGDGTFRRGPQFSTPEFPYRPAVADFNNDGRPDVAVPCYYGYAVQLFLNGPTGLVPSGQISTPHGTYGCFALTAGNIDQDGNADLLISADRNIWSALGDGEGHFGPLSPLDTTYSILDLAITDVDGDGVNDIAYASFGVRFRLGDGHGGFGPATELNRDVGARNFVFADMNGDGLKDLVTSDQSGSESSMSILLAEAPGIFGPAEHFSSPHGNRDLGVADLNGDGVLDAVVCPYNSSAVAIYLGNGGGQLGGGTVVPTGFRVASVELADLDQDSALDLVMCESSASTSDTNGNGDPADDSAPTNAAEPRIVVMRGTGHSTFTPWATLTTPAPVSRVYSFDLDHNGHLDLAATTPVSYYGMPGKLFVFLSNGQPSFGVPITVDCGVGPSDVLPEDFDADGAMDLAILNTGVMSEGGYDPGGVDILYRAACGSACQTRVTIYDTPFPSSIAMGDFDGDQQPDLAIGNSRDGGIAIRLDRPGRVFAPGLHPTSGPVLSLAAADFDLDGNLDLAAITIFDYSYSAPMIYRGLGDGSFADPVILPTGEGDRFVLAPDLDSDGSPELLSMRNYGKSLWVHRNQRDGTFSLPEGYGNFFAASPVAVGDVTGDGRKDLVMPHYIDTKHADGVLILRNQSDETVAVHITDLQVHWVDAGVELAWYASADEDGSFVVQRAAGGSELFEQVGAGIAALPGQSEYRWVDPTVEAGSSYVYRIGMRGLGGIWAWSQPVITTIPSLAFALDAPRYDLGSRAVILRYTVPSQGPTTLGIFDAAGRKLRSWIDIEPSAGRGSVRWDGTDDRGIPAGSGIYFARLDWKGQSRSTKIPWLR